MTDDEYEIGDASRTAATTVSEERDSHGDAYTNHRQIANLWTAFLDDNLNTDIQPWQAAIMMQQVKQSRMMAGYLTFDHFADISGYSDVALESALRDPGSSVSMDEFEQPNRAEIFPSCHHCGAQLGPEWIRADERARADDENPADCLDCGENPLPPVGDGG
jgi:hypothetical protein